MAVDEVMPQRRWWRLEADTSEAYERYLVPALFASWAERLLDLVAVGPGERVLDVACGTGIVARRAAARVGEGGAVTGLDRNPAMLEVARAAAIEVGPPIDWRAGDAARLPFPDGVFDVVTCQQGLTGRRHEGRGPRVPGPRSPPEPRAMDRRQRGGVPHPGLAGHRPTLARPIGRCITRRRPQAGGMT
jgi:SAM-dependent methyltransferase